MSTSGICCGSARWKARRERAKRGELLVAAPVGYCKTEDRRLGRDPDSRGQDGHSLSVSPVRAIVSVRQTLLWFLDRRLRLMRMSLRSRVMDHLPK